MKKLVIYLLLIFSSTQVVGQEGQIDNSFEQGGWSQFLTQNRYERPLDEVKGDYYLFHDWVDADINLADDRQYKKRPMNVNLLTGDIEVPVGDRIRILDRAKIRSFKIGDRKFINSGLIDKSVNKNVFFEVIEDGALNGSIARNTFFEVIEEGDIKVYCQYYSVVRQPSYGVPGSGTDRIYTALIRKIYFVQSGLMLKKFTRSK
ncbi:MAG: hypothetical protein RIA63_09280, partial [Cyclobacteriaceae bacterium]